MSPMRHAPSTPHAGPPSRSFTVDAAALWEALAMRWGWA